MEAKYRKNQSSALSEKSNLREMSDSSPQSEAGEMVWTLRSWCTAPKGKHRG